MPDAGDDDLVNWQHEAPAPSEVDTSDQFSGIRFAWFLLAVLVAVGIWQFATNGFDDVDPDTGDPVVDVDGDD